MKDMPALYPGLYPAAAIPCIKAISPSEGWTSGRTTLKLSKKLFKGIDRSFELRGEIRLIRSVMTNWRLGNFFYLILSGLHHKISKKPIVAA
jgi:hypothetical protein